MFGLFYGYWEILPIPKRITDAWFGNFTYCAKSLTLVLLTFIHKSWHFPREQFMSDNKIPYISKSIQQNHILPSTQVTFNQWKPTSNSFLCCFGLSRLRWCCIMQNDDHIPSLHNVPLYYSPFIFEITKKEKKLFCLVPKWPSFQFCTIYFKVKTMLFMFQIFTCPLRNVIYVQVVRILYKKAELEVCSAGLILMIIKYSMMANRNT